MPLFFYIFKLYSSLNHASWSVTHFISYLTASAVIFIVANAPNVSQPSLSRLPFTIFRFFTSFYFLFFFGGLLLIHSLETAVPFDGIKRVWIYFLSLFFFLGTFVRLLLTRGFLFMLHRISHWKERKREKIRWQIKYSNFQQLKPINN